MNNEKTCENCAYFSQHYGWVANHFTKVCCGHCKKRKLTAREQRSFPFLRDCEEWQPKEKEIARQHESLKELLTCMAMRINEISAWIENISKP